MNLIVIIQLIAGLAILIIGAELLVRGASRLALAIGISPLVVGSTVVAFGTSSPELAVSLQAALSGQADIALGNVIGSNIFNILVIIGLAAAVTPLMVAQQLVRLDVPFMIILSGLVFVLGLNSAIDRLEGALLFAVLILYVLFLIRLSRKESEEVISEYAREFGDGAFARARQWLLNLGLVAGGLVLLILGSRWLVMGATSLARALGLSELIIGLTIIAFGTSLPEVATSLMAAIRGERDIAVGNAIGSNIFNILLVLGLTALLSPSGIAIPQSVLAFDLPIMIVVAVAALPIFFTGYTISRWEGWLFLGLYGGYVLYLLLDATQHDALPLFNAIMLIFVLPLVALTLLVLAVRELRHRRSNRSATPSNSDSAT